MRSGLIRNRCTCSTEKSQRRRRHHKRRHLQAAQPHRQPDRGPMSAALEARVAMLERQLASLLRRHGAPFALARSTLPVVDTGAVQTVQAQLDALSVREGIPVLYGYGVTGSPPTAA